MGYKEKRLKFARTFSSILCCFAEWYMCANEAHELLLVSWKMKFDLVHCTWKRLTLKLNYHRFLSIFNAIFFFYIVINATLNIRSTINRIERSMILFISCSFTLAFFSFIQKCMVAKRHTHTHIKRTIEKCNQESP